MLGHQPIFGAYAPNARISQKLALKTRLFWSGVTHTEFFLSSHIRTYYLQPSTMHASLLDKKNGCLPSMLGYVKNPAASCKMHNLYTG